MVFCVLDFRKAKNTRLVARVFLRFSQVSQHPKNTKLSTISSDDFAKHINFKSLLM